MANLMNLEQAIERVKQARRDKRKAWIVSVPREDKEAFLSAIKGLRYGVEIESSSLNPDRLIIYGHCTSEMYMAYLDAMNCDE